MSVGKKILCVVGARPNFMKIAPIMSALEKHARVLRPYLVHTGQHYDEAMKRQFFHQLGIPEPDIDLEVGSGTHAVQTANIMLRFEPVMDNEAPAAVLVVGDVNSTLACALVASKKNVPVVHVEAGLRSHDRTMPEEINRIVTDQISDLLFTTERNAADNLIKEGIGSNKIHFVGNVMIDTLLKHRQRAIPAAQTLVNLPLAAHYHNNPKGFALLTLHRPSNVDDPAVLERLLLIIRKISEDLPVVFPVHPRTEAKIAAYGLMSLIESKHICRLPPLGYLELLGLMSEARLVLTDSGGIQEETTALGVPCLTLRYNTERPITVEQGTNTVVGADPDNIIRAYEDIITTGGKAGRTPELWDGKAAERIVAILRDWI